MRQLLLIINLFVWTHLMYSQSIALKGYVYEHPDTTSAETLKPARGIWISHPKAKPTLTDSQGRFTLYFSEVAEGNGSIYALSPWGSIKTMFCSHQTKYETSYWVAIMSFAYPLHPKDYNVRDKRHWPTIAWQVTRAMSKWDSVSWMIGSIAWANDKMNIVSSTKQH